MRTQEYIFPRKLIEEIKQKALRKHITISEFIKRDKKKYEKYKIENYGHMRVRI